MSDGARSPIPQRVEQLLPDKSKPSSKATAGKYNVSAQEHRVPWKIDQATGEVEYDIPEKTKKWLDSKFYGDLGGMVGKQVFWHHLRDEEQRPQAGAIYQYYRDQRVNQLFKRVRRVPQVKRAQPKHNATTLEADAVHLGKFARHGYNYQFNIVDTNSRYVWARFYASMTAQNALEATNMALKDIAKWHGKDGALVRRIRIRTDLGSEFSPALFKAPLEAKWSMVTVVYNKAHTPNMTAAVERANQSLQFKLKRRVAVSGWPRRKKDMNPWLQKIVDLHNNTWSQPLNANPFTIMMMNRTEIDQRNVHLKNKKAPVARKAPKQILSAKERKLLRPGVQVRLVNAAFRKAKLKGFMKYGYLSSETIYTVHKVLRGRADAPMKVLIMDPKGKVLPLGYSIHEVVIVHADQAPPPLAGRTRDEISRSYKKAETIDPGERFKKGTRLSILWNKENKEWYTATVLGKTSAKGWVRVKFDQDGTVRMYNMFGTDTPQRPRQVEGVDYTFL